MACAAVARQLQCGCLTKAAMQGPTENSQPHHGPRALSLPRPALASRMSLTGLGPRAFSSSSLSYVSSAALQSTFGISSRTHGRVQMSYGYGSSRRAESEADDQKWTLLQARGYVLAAFALTFLLVPGYVFNKVLPKLGEVFRDPRTYPEVWSYGQQARGAVRHLPTLAHFAGALFFSSSVLDILIARARSHEALRFKVMGDLISSVILVAYLTTSVLWNYYPRSDLGLIVMYLLRGLWDLRIWFEESYAT